MQFKIEPVTRVGNTTVSCQELMEALKWVAPNIPISIKIDDNYAGIASVELEATPEGNEDHEVTITLNT